MRPIAWAVAGSFLLHLLLLWPAVSPRQTAQSTAMLAATLQPQQAELPGTIFQPANPDVVTAPVHRPPPRPPAERASDSMAAVSPAAAAVGMAKVDGSSAGEPIPPGAVGAVASPAATARAPAPNDGIDADGLRKFRLDLATQARRNKNYPPRALAAGWRGTAEVRLTVERGGIVQEPELTRSSGFAVLDVAALDMLARAAPQTAIPESLYGRTFSVVLPVVFDVTAE